MQTIDTGGALDQGPPPLYTPEQLTRLRTVLSRSPFYVDLRYGLLLLAANSVIGQKIQVLVDMRDLEGNAKHQVFAFTPTSNRAENFFEIPLGEGLLFGVAVNLFTNVDVGTCWVQVNLTINPFGGATLQQVSTLLSGFPTGEQSVAWPYVGTLPQVRTQFPVLVQGTTPAAGQNWSISVPTGAVWAVQWVEAELDTSAAGGTRGPLLQLTRGGVTVFLQAPTVQPVGNASVRYQWSPAWPISDVSNGGFRYNSNPLPNGLVLLAGDALSVTTVGLDVADNWIQPFILVLENLRVT